MTFDEATDILFEYGADKRNDPVGFTPDDDNYWVDGDGVRHYGAWRTAGRVTDQSNDADNVDGYVIVTDEMARSGTRSIKEYQPPPNFKDDGDRRIVVRTSLIGPDTELDRYYSWWVYFPDNMFDLIAWRSFGGIQLRYTGSVRNGIRFFQNGSSDKLIIRLDSIYTPVSSPPRSSTPFVRGHSHEADAANMADLLNAWHHLQLHYEIHETNGAAQAWIDGEIVFDESGPTDPRGDPEWSSHDWLSWTDERGYFSASVYNNLNEPECWYFWDDYVCATEYVPDWYRIIPTPPRPYAQYGHARYGGHIYNNFKMERCDINEDHIVSGYDLGFFADAYGSSEGEEYWNEDADIDPTGLIDGFDLGLFADYYGEDWSV